MSITDFSNEGLRQRRSDWDIDDKYSKDHDIKGKFDTDDEVVYNTPTKRHLLPSIDIDNEIPGSPTYVSPTVRNQVLAVLVVLAFATRALNISNPHSVVFDEVHFGKFASYYIRGTWFFDVHPPLGKLMFAAAGWLAGYDGSFSFKEIHMDYLKHDVPYVAMRMVSAISGAMLVPLAYKTLQTQGHSFYGCFIAAVLVLLDNSLLTQSRFILLDMPMLLFIAMAIYADSKTRAYWKTPFSSGWWVWLALTGVSLGLALSVKWVGLFVIAYVGLHTIKDLWDIVCDRQNPMHIVGKHFLARVLCLIVIPIVLYIAIFDLHLKILVINGPGVTFMGPGFGDYLQSPVYPNERQVKYGGQLNLQSLMNADKPVYLHSHNHLYRHADGSGQQQVTGYAHKDHNNWFEIQQIDADGKFSEEVVKNGDKVRLFHVPTGKSMYMHGFPAPVTKELAEVSMDAGAGDEFEVKIDRLKIEQTKNPLMKRFKSEVREGKALELHNVVRFIHAKTRCAVMMSPKLLPAWGYSQFEVGCIKPTNTNGTETYPTGTEFTIAEIQHANLLKWTELKEAKNPPMSFGTRMSYIWLYQYVAWDTNKRLSKDHVFGSRPQHWPVMRRGVSYWQDGQSGEQIYLLGNPVVYFLCLLCPLLYALVGSVMVLRARRGYQDIDRARSTRLTSLLFMWVGMALHYFPFFLMERQLFFHHYLPAHYFMILAVAGFTDEVLKIEVVSRHRRALLGGLCLVVFWGFCKFAHLSYAYPIDYAYSESVRWRSTWDMMRMEDPSKPLE